MRETWLAEIAPRPAFWIQYSSYECNNIVIDQQKVSILSHLIFT